MLLISCVMMILDSIESVGSEIEYFFPSLAKSISNGSWFDRNATLRKQPLAPVDLSALYPGSAYQPWTALGVHDVIPPVALPVHNHTPLR